MNLIEEVEELEKELHNAIENKEWDVPKEAPIECFDPELSYELTGYKPINKTKGLDFNPDWFTEARDTYEKTGKYCAYLPGSKRYREFWREQFIRCKYGYTVNGYTVTGFHYFFLNFYTLPLVHKVVEAGKGRPEGFPKFTVAQYIWFHYLALCCKLLKNAALMKTRGCGFSEINAAMAAAEFTIIRESNTIITCYDKGKLEKTLKKAWHALAFLDKNTQGGMSKNKQIKNTELQKTSGAFKLDHGTQIPTGWQSTILGIVADNPQKIRGDRADFLLFDEAGSWPDLETAVIQGDALVEIGGVRFGVAIYGGTGGDDGKNLEGLRKIYYNPKSPVMKFFMDLSNLQSEIVISLLDVHGTDMERCQECIEKLKWDLKHNDFQPELKEELVNEINKMTKIYKSFYKFDKDEQYKITKTFRRFCAILFHGKPNIQKFFKRNKV